MTHNNPKTYPRLATPVAFVEPEDLLDAAAAVVRLHRDHGDRGNRRHARLKYVIAENGEEWARERLSEYLGKTARAVPRRCRAFAVPDHLGWHEQGDGKLYLGMPVSSGRIVDDELAAAHRVARDRQPFPLRSDPDAEPGHHLERDPPGGSRRDRGDAARARRAPRRGNAAGRALGAGLPGPAELRAGA